MCIMKKSVFLVFLALILYSTHSVAQIYLSTGLNLSKVRDNNLLTNKKFLTGIQMGGGIKYYPTRSIPKLSITNEVLFNGRGYEQQLDEKYKIMFSYLSAPFLLNYNILDELAITGGVEPSLLVSTNLIQGTNTYKRYDLGLVLGASIFDNQRFSLYTRMTYGVIPTLKYEKMDKIGNIVENINDVKNICFTIGFKINLRNEKIKFYK